MNLDLVIFQYDLVHLADWAIYRSRKNNYHCLCGPADTWDKWYVSVPIVLLDRIAMEAITATGRRYDLTAPRANHYQTRRKSPSRWDELTLVDESDELCLVGQKILPWLVHACGPNFLQSALEAIELKITSPATWAPELAKLLALLDIDPHDYHRAVGLDKKSWGQALRGDVHTVSPRVALHAWLIPEILGLGYPLSSTREERLQWLHRGKSRIGNHTSPKALLLSGETGAFVTLFTRLMSAPLG
jgi:hypothetical protein